MSKSVRAWHFVGATLRDGTPVPQDGVWLEVEGSPVMCMYGLHAGPTPYDALRYAPGPILCEVELAGTILYHTDKMVARRRRILRRMDATELLRYFARMQALSMIHLWESPDVVLDYLMTGDESIREATRDAAWAARCAAKATRGVAWATRHTVCDVTSAAAATAREAASAAWFASAVSCAAREASGEDSRDEFNSLVWECFT